MTSPSFDPAQFSAAQAQEAREERERLLQIVYVAQRQANAWGEILDLWERWQEKANETRSHNLLTRSVGAGV